MPQKSSCYYRKVKTNPGYQGVDMSQTHHMRAPVKAAGKAAANPFSEFLNPNSMITPGAAGAFTMVITNTLCQQFDPLPLNYTGLAVSFLFGTMVFTYGASLVRRGMYFVINSLIIFVVAMGSSAIGVHVNESANAKTAALESVDTAGKVNSFSVASADKPAPAPKSSSPPPPPASKPFFRRWM